MVGTKVSVDEALDLILTHVTPLPAELRRVDADLLHHVTDRPITAAHDTPRFDCSAMDGFAVRSVDTMRASPGVPAILTLAGEIAAQGPLTRLAPGAAAPISTGGPIPEGADAVVIQERCETLHGNLLVRDRVRIGLNIRRRGEDLPQGGSIIAPGTPLSPEAIGALLAYGVPQIWCRRPPRITVLPTGSEIIAGTTTGTGSRFDSNGPMVAALSRQLGLQPSVSRPIADDLRSVTAAFAAACENGQNDMIVSTGGVSSGNHDLVRNALENLSARIIFHGIAMRPGKPLLFALLADGRPFFGLPGNPVAALVGFRFFVAAAIRRQMELPGEQGCEIVAPVEGRDGTTLFLSARRSPANLSGAVPLDDQRSHVMRSPLAADCWLRVDRSETTTTARLYPKQPSLTDWPQP
ncbi:MAG: molybdopterin molybdotransferase MoeA [Sphingopyxis sp.]|nr:molybdopterin molybdotransferase MoeA [Sphingopyxis sp.]